MTNGHTSHLHNDYLDKSLSPKLRQVVEQHIKGCKSCKSDFETLRSLKRHLAEIEAPDPGQQYFANLTNQVLLRTVDAPPKPSDETIKSISMAKSRDILKTLIRLAAAITLLFGSFYISNLLQGQQKGLGSNYSQQKDGIIDPIASPETDHRQITVPQNSTPAFNDIENNSTDNTDAP